MFYLTLQGQYSKIFLTLQQKFFKKMHKKFAGKLAEIVQCAERKIVLISIIT
nr:MAG TPA: hypothetical protein [Caudoviricetes sp.]